MLYGIQYYQNKSVVSLGSIYNVKHVLNILPLLCMKEVNKTQPKPPSPNTLSGRKFLVVAFNSLKEKALQI
jgi:hypothetical protein